MTKDIDIVVDSSAQRKVVSFAESLGYHGLLELFDAIDKAR